jgi:hypothetical protein
MSLTTSKQFQYAYDIALIHQARMFFESEVNLKMDLEILILPLLAIAAKPR